MKVLLLGATGNLGSRLVPALLTHGLSVTCFVRSAGKLRGLLPPTVHDQITIIEGDAKTSAVIKRAVLESECDAVVNAAGVAAAAPWGKTDLPEIFKAVLQGIQEACVERQRPIRVWFVAGMGVLNYPGTEKMISSYIPLYVAYRQNLRLLKNLPPSTFIDWSILCPMT
ncbi:hypothetical protein KC322_g15787, partial [Hortaea werneckii]